MSKGRNRTMSICLTEIDKTKITKHENGKKYLQVSTYDYDAPDRFDNDFSVSLSLTKEEQEAKAAGQTVKRCFIGNGKIWPDTNKMKELSKEDMNDEDIDFVG